MGLLRELRGEIRRTRPLPALRVQPGVALPAGSAESRTVSALREPNLRTRPVIIPRGKSAHFDTTTHYTRRKETCQSN